MDKSIVESLESFGLKKTLSYLDSDPDKNIPKILDWLIKLDKDDKYVLLFENDWSMRWSEEKNKNLELLEISVKEFN
jgi:peptide subunit release factor RF-3